MHRRVLPLVFAALTGCDAGGRAGKPDDTAVERDTRDTRDTGESADSEDTGESGHTAESGDTSDTGDTSDSADSRDTGPPAAPVGEVALDEAAVVITGTEPGVPIGDHFTLGELTGDDVPDLLLRDLDGEDLLLRVLPGPWEEDVVADDAHTLRLAPTADGWDAVGAPVDLDGDGAPDLLLVSGERSAVGYLRGPFGADADLQAEVSQAVDLGDRTVHPSAVTLLPDLDGDAVREVAMVHGTLEYDVEFQLWRSRLRLYPESADRWLGGGEHTHQILGTESEELDVVTGAADLDGDGVAELLVNRDLVLHEPLAEGADLADADVLRSRAVDSNMAWLAAVTDVDGDGLADLAAGGTMAEGLGVGVLTRPSRTPVLESDAHLRVMLADDEDLLGNPPATLGDLDGDGWLDLLVSRPYADLGAPNAGGASVLYGPLGGTWAADEADALLGGAPADTHVGSTVALEDVDRDGFADLLLGAHAGDREAVGTLWLLRSGPR